MKFYVDRIENNKIAVCIDENEKVIEIKLKVIVGCVVEGSIIKKIGSKFVVDEKETALKKEEMFKLQNDLFNN